MPQIDWWDAHALSTQTLEEWMGFLEQAHHPLCEAVGVLLRIESPKTNHGGAFLTAGFVSDTVLGVAHIRVAGLLTITTSQRTQTEVRAVFFVFSGERRLTWEQQHGDYAMMTYVPSAEGGGGVWQDFRWYRDEQGEFTRFQYPESVMQ